MAERSLTEQLASWLVRWRTTGVPFSTLNIARAYVLDWLGSALAGTSTEPGKRLLQYAQTQPPGSSPIVGTRLRLSPEGAALVNGGLSHIVEMDDLDRASVVHPGAVVIPAALAAAEGERATGIDFLSAVVAGYEVAIRVGEAVGKRHYYHFHNTSTCGVFGAAAASGWLLGLNEGQFVWALGNAGTQAAGLWEFNAEGAMSKHLHAGRAAANGMLAAALARQGFTGARRILEGKRGFFAATAPDAEPSRVLAGLDADSPSFKIHGVSIKPYPSCRHTHPAIDAARGLHPQLDGRIVERVRIETYRAALDLCNDPDPQTAYAAKFSLHYCVASALLRGQAGLADFTQEAISDPAVHDLLSHITAAVDPAFEACYPAQWPARVRLTLEDGETLTSTVSHPKGDPEHPLTPQELEDKFRQLAAYGGHAAEAGSLIEWVESLEADRPLVYTLAPDR